MYKASGTEHLGRDGGSTSASPRTSTPSGGKPVGGTDNPRANGTTKTGGAKATPSTSYRRPAGVQGFTDGSV